MSFITDNTKEKPLSARILLYLFFLFFGLLLGSLVSVVITKFMGSGSNALKLSQAISSTLMFVAPPLMLYFFTRKNPFRQIGFTKPNNAIVVLGGILVMFISLPTINLLTSWNENIQLPASLAKIEEVFKTMEETAAELTEQMLNVNTIGGLIINLLVIALIPAIGEELTFRGVIQQFLTKTCKNAHVAIILSAAIFSAIHFQFYGFLPRMVLGVFLGYFFYMTKSLWTSIIMHFANNALAVTAYYLNNIGVIDIDVDSVGATQWHITIISAIGCISLIVYSWHKMKAENDNHQILNN